MIDGATYVLTINRPNQPSYDIPLGTEALRSLVMAIADDAANADLIETLAAHPAAAIRAVVASYDGLGSAAIEELEVDGAIEVRRALLQSRAFQRQVTTERLRAFASGDVDLATTIAGDLDLFTEIDVAIIADHLSGHSDPAVRIALARCTATPHPLRRRLRRDLDADVAQAASESQSL